MHPRFIFLAGNKDHLDSEVNFLGSILVHNGVIFNIVSIREKQQLNSKYDIKIKLVTLHNAYSRTLICTRVTSLAFYPVDFYGDNTKTLSVAFFLDTLLASSIKHQSMKKESNHIAK